MWLTLALSPLAPCISLRKLLCSARPILLWWVSPLKPGAKINPSPCVYDAFLTVAEAIAILNILVRNCPFPALDP